MASQGSEHAAAVDPRVDGIGPEADGPLQTRQRLGLPPEGRKFTPHVSLARLRGTSAEEIARFIELSGRFAPLEFPVGRFVLFSSKDSVGGGPYLVEQAYPLAA